MPSSVIKEAYYRPDEAALEILFTTGRRYLYHDVRPEEAERFAAAFSKGRYFNARIRDRYAFTELCRHRHKCRMNKGLENVHATSPAEARSLRHIPSSEEKSHA